MYTTYTSSTHLIVHIIKWINKVAPDILGSNLLDVIIIPWNISDKFVAPFQSVPINIIMSVSSCSLDSYLDVVVGKGSYDVGANQYFIYSCGV